MNKITTLMCAMMCDYDDIAFLYDMAFSEDPTAFHEGDVIGIEAIRLHLNSHTIFEKSEDENYYIFQYSVSTMEIIPIYVPKNGDIIFCEF